MKKELTEAAISYETVFNYPALADCYKVAAFDGINRLGTFEPDPAEIPQTG
jgi:hypothetical protein